MSVNVGPVPPEEEGPAIGLPVEYDFHGLVGVSEARYDAVQDA